MYKALTLFCTLLSCAVDFTRADRTLLGEQPRLDELIAKALTLSKAMGITIDEKKLISALKEIVADPDLVADYENLPHCPPHGVGVDHDPEQCCAMKLLEKLRKRYGEYPIAVELLIAVFTGDQAPLKMLA